MATQPRYFQKYAYYHVYNRGNRKQNIFLQSRDYQRFLTRAEEYKNKLGVKILSYCLMPNHFHFLLRQETDTPITYFMLRLGTSYSKYFNIKYEQVGTLFQGPFKAKIVESDEYLLHLSRYIHRNPLSLPALIRGVGLSYEWSSYSEYLNGWSNDLVDSSYILNYFDKNNPEQDYKQFTEHNLIEDKDQNIKDLVFEEE